jgi:TDG/mug DNA glycosylase family protein
MLIETHPFGDFVPPKTRYLILGSFTGRQGAPGSPDYDGSYDWFYGRKVNQFWPILSAIYGSPLETKKQKQVLFTKLHLAIADIILRCERKAGNNLDSSLINIVYNKKGVKKILQDHAVEKIYFTSRFTETKFRDIFKDLIAKNKEVNLITLPSPSPRYAAISKQEKIKRYRSLLPRRA